MTNLDSRLRELVELACSQPPGHLVRQQALTQIIRTIDRQLWREYIDGYEDALQLTWLYFCRNICEATTGERYDPNRANLVTWLNNYLKHRVQDLNIDRFERLRTFTDALNLGTDGELIDVIDTIPAAPDIPPLLKDIRTWAETDTDGTLRSTHIQGHPQANCQLLILRRLPPETSWDSLSNELGISISTLSAFYQRRCQPILHNFGRSEGYV
jgi:hypothetical protein